MNESSLLWFNYPLPMNGERDAYGDRKLSQRGPGWGWSWFLSFSDTFHRGSSASPSGSLTGTGLSPESRLQRCWAGLIFFFFLIFSELSQEELLERHSRWSLIN